MHNITKGTLPLLFDTKGQIDIHEYSAISLAFLGDSVLDLLMRTRLLERTRLSPARLHDNAVKVVSAKGQHKALELIEPLLTEREQTVLRRGKNATKNTVAKNATAKEYSSSTALEAVFGWLYMQNDKERIEYLFDVIWQGIYINGADKE